MFPFSHLIPLDLSADLRWTLALFHAIKLSLFMPSNGSTSAAQVVNPANWQSLPRAKPGRRTSLTQVIAMQDAAFQTAMALRDDVLEADDKEERARAASALSNVSKAWSSMEDIKRILRGKPLPGSLRPERKPSKKRTVSLAPTEEPINPAQAKVSSPASDGTSS